MSSSPEYSSFHDDPDSWDTEDTESPDNLTDQDSLYLIRQRIENLREKIGLEFDEILEIQELEAIYHAYDDSQDMPEDLGVPSKIQEFLAALEGKRVNRYQDEEYDGGDVDEQDEPTESSVNQYYQNLLKESHLNLKSLKLLSSEKTPIMDFKQNGKKKEITMFDLYETLPQEFSFPEFLANLWQIPESEALQKLQEVSQAEQWELKSKWETYREERGLKSPSAFQQFLIRCQHFVTSPIYDTKDELKDEHYRLEDGTEFWFTDKTIVFLIPFKEFEDIPQKAGSPANVSQIAFLEVAFILPEYAHERKRFFRKNGTVEEFVRYLDKLGVALSEKQIKFLKDLADAGALRLYREVLELPDRDEIRGYFLNIQSGVGEYSKGYLLQCLRERLKTEEALTVRIVTPFHTWFPEWMRKIGGLIVEEKYGEAVTIPKPLQISVDMRLQQYAFKLERIFMPSERLMNVNSTKEEWEKEYLAEMREAYRIHPKHFKKLAKELAEKRVEIRCACNHGGTQHEERCVVPILMRIFKKIGEGTASKKTL